MASQSTMWGFLGGTPPPAKKRKLSEADKAQKSTDYERNKRVRTYQAAWETKFPWMENKDGKMFCTWCSKQSFQGQFVQGGCTNFKAEALTRHERSEPHRKAEAWEAAAKAKPGTTLAEKAYQALTAQEQTRLVHLFKTCHAMAKNGRPYTDFMWLCKLDTAKGVDIGSTYGNDKQAACFTRFIAKEQYNSIRQRILDSAFISIMCDGSTDSGITEQEILYVRCVISGVPETYFVGVRSVERADAASITESVVSSFSEYLDLPKDQWITKLVGVGTDGASVMTGCNSGVVVRLQRLDKSAS